MQLYLKAQIYDVENDTTSGCDSNAWLDDSYQSTEIDEAGCFALGIEVIVEDPCTIESVSSATAIILIHEFETISEILSYTHPLYASYDICPITYAAISSEGEVVEINPSENNRSYSSVYAGDAIGTGCA